MVDHVIDISSEEIIMGFGNSYKNNKIGGA